MQIRMNASVGVFLRDNQIIVVPQGGGGGHYYDLDDVLIAAPSESEVQRVIEEAIQISGRAYGGPVPADIGTRKWSVLKRLGLKSARAFHVNVSHAAVFLYDGKIEVFPYRPANKSGGFEGDGDPIRVDNIKSLGSVLLRVLKESPRMNPPGRQI